MSETVSVVIPTVGRPELAQALESVRGQDHADIEIIVVVDRPESAAAVRDLLRGPAERCVVTEGQAGGSAARNLGTAAATGEYVALLDDDDWWEPEKVSGQLEALTREGAELSWTQTSFHEASGRVRHLPERDYDGSADIGTYLVARPGLRHGAGYIQTSSLLLRRSLALRFPWDESLPKHQDWDLVVRMVSDPTVRWAAVPRALVNVRQDSSGSVSRKRDWRSSQRWLDQHSHLMSNRGQADFVFTHLVRSALSTGDWSAAARLTVYGVRRRPHLAAVVVGLAGTAEWLRKRRTGKSEGKAS